MFKAVCTILSLLLFVQLCLGGSCGDDYPSLNSSFIYSGSFSLSNQYVGPSEYVYYYLSAIAGRYYSVTMTPELYDLDIVGSRANYSISPTIYYNEYYEFRTGNSAETISFVATSTECYVLGVYGFGSNSGNFALEVIDSATTPPPTPAPSWTPFPTYAPTSSPSYESFCKTLLGSSTLNYLDGSNNDYSSIDAGQYKYYYYSAYSKEQVIIVTSTSNSIFSSGDDADVDLYVADASVNPNPTVNSYTDVSASEGVRERIEVSTGDSRKCYAIGVYAKTSGSYKLSVSSYYKGGASLSLILGLGIGLPVGLCCVLPISIALFCVYGLRPKSRVVVPKSGSAKGSPGGEVDLDTAAYTS